MHSMRFGGSEFVNSARWFVGASAAAEQPERPGSAAGRRVGGCASFAHACKHLQLVCTQWHSRSDPSAQNACLTIVRAGSWRRALSLRSLCGLALLGAEWAGAFCTGLQACVACLYVVAR